MSEAAYNAVKNAREEIARLEQQRMKQRRVTVTVTEHQLATLLAAADVTLSKLKSEVPEEKRNSILQGDLGNEIRSLEEAVKAVNESWTQYLFAPKKEGT